ncbi:zf-HC2 domain-containing protein [Streptomyces sp. NPDC005706]|uniref:zf-HC2 domain-containing protein n=1 Tax=Streptomyces sp. NPDC005706 TaxID=3157169 RepID=UPI0033DCA1B3
MSSEVTCGRLRELGAELALGVLDGRERAAAVAHLDGCAECREYVEHLTLVGDRLIGLLPDREPPLGFETRVARALTQDVTAYERRPPVRASLREGPRGRAGRVRLRLASVAVAFAVAFGFAGWGIGTAIEEVTAAPAAPAGTETMLVGDLTSAGSGARPAGEVYAHPGSPGWVFMSVDLTAPGAVYDGKVTCLLERSDGTTVRLGDFPVHEGRGAWGVAASVDPGAVSGARLTAPDGTVLATAPLQTGQVRTGEA